MIRLALVLLLLLSRPAAAGPELCEAAAHRAAAEVGVPVDLMLAITLVETGRRRGGVLRPWPWAANLEGAGHWFDTRAELERFAEGAVAAGRTSIDIGCFQINWRWHGQHFTRPADLAEPIVGARYAARHLADLRRELGSWEAASGAYHSRTPHLAARYAARVAALRPGAARTPPPPLPALAAAPAPDPAPNPGSAWPMPEGAAAPGALASLFPATPQTRPFLTGLAP